VIANGIDALRYGQAAGATGEGRGAALRWRDGCMPLPQRLFAPECTVGRCIWFRALTASLSAPPSMSMARHRAGRVGSARPARRRLCGAAGLGEYELAECAAGLRPMTPDNLPSCNAGRTYSCCRRSRRSGFLLAPWTAEQIVSELLPVGSRW